VIVSPAANPSFQLVSSRYKRTELYRELLQALGEMGRGVGKATGGAAMIGRFVHDADVVSR
jgi:hypothetical protein